MKAHPVPDAALEADIATLAQKGAGKTYANRGLVERLLSAGRRVVVMDPLNSWWGLKALANGKPGFPVIVVGGPNADVLLDPAAGEKLGTFIAGAQMSVVVDVSDLKRGELIRFSIDFLAALYRLNRDPLWLVLEEADVFAPQNPMGDQTMLLHQVDQIARRGRARGFRLWSITQRPARLHKDVLSMASTLILMRIRSPQDRAAAEDWIKGNAEAPQAREIVNSLASLQVGEGWVWAPDQDLLERVTFPPIRTLDTSATPQAGEVRAAAPKLAQGDVAALRLALSTPAEPVVRNKDGPQFVDPDAADRARAEGYAAGTRATAEVLRQVYLPTAEYLKTRLAEIGQQIADLEAHNSNALQHLTGLAKTPAPVSSPDAKVVRPRAAKTAPIVGEQLDPPSQGARRLLAAIAGAPALRVRWADVGILAVMSSTSGYTRAAINELRAKGLITEAAEGVGLASRTGEEQLLDAVELVDAWANKLGGAAAKILRHLYVKGPETTDQVARGAELSPTAGYTRGGWKALRNNNLVRETDGAWDIAQVLRDLKRARS